MLIRKLNKFCFLNYFFKCKQLFFYIFSCTLISNSQAFSICHSEIVLAVEIVKSSIYSKIIHLHDYKNAKNSHYLKMSRIKYQQQDSEMIISITPNPTQNNFRLLVSSASEKRILVNIFDVSGKTIQTILTRSNQILYLGNNWKSGVYFAEVIMDKKRKRIKMEKFN